MANPSTIIDTKNIYDQNKKKYLRNPSWFIFAMNSTENAYRDSRYKNSVPKAMIR